MLDRTNYTEWAMLMHVNYEALEIWKVIEPGEKVKRAQDRQAMGALLRSVPKEMWTTLGSKKTVNEARAQDRQAMGALLRSDSNKMWTTLGSKKTVKEAWELVKTIRLGADRVKDVNAQKLLKEFENMSFMEGETIDDFGMRINNLVANLKSLGEIVDDTCVMKKFLRVVPPRFSQLVVSIEMFCDMKTLTVEELVGRLRAAEDRLDDKVEQITDKSGRVLLAEEDWLEKHKQRSQSNPTKEGNQKSFIGTGNT